MYEWLPYDNGILDNVPESETERKKWLKEWRSKNDRKVADRFRNLLIKKYGKKRGERIQYAEAFEISEYGGNELRSQFNKGKLAFPFFPF